MSGLEGEYQTVAYDYREHGKTEASDTAEPRCLSSRTSVRQYLRDIEREYSKPTGNRVSAANQPGTNGPRRDVILVNHNTCLPSRRTTS